MAMATVSNRPELIHLDVDRRLGHEWDEWDGQPLPNAGNFDAPPRIFFGWSLGWILAVTLVMAILLFVLAPGPRRSTPPSRSGWAPSLVVISSAVLLWWTLIALSFAFRANLLPEKLADR